MLPKSATTLLATITIGASLGCVDQLTPTSPPLATARDASASPTGGTSLVTPALIRQLAAGRGIVPLPPRPYVRPALVKLGQALTFDSALSGNRNISCSTCHLPAFATGDGKSLSVGDGVQCGEQLVRMRRAVRLGRVEQGEDLLLHARASTKRRASNVAGVERRASGAPSLLRRGPLVVDSAPNRASGAGLIVCHAKADRAMKARSAAGALDAADP